MKEIRKLSVRLIIFALIGLSLNILIANILAESKRDWIKAGRYYPKIQLREFYELPDSSLNVVMMGSSRCFYGIDPFIIQEKTGLKCFNLGTPHQPFSAMYYLLEEVFEHHVPEFIILEIHYEMLTRTYLRPYKVYVMENMQNSNNKLDLFLYGFSTSEKLRYFLPMMQNQAAFKYIFNKITGNLKDQFTDSEKYLGLGYVSSYEKLDPDNYEKIAYEWQEKSIVAEAIYYYPLIVELVQNSGAKLIVVNFPYPALTRIENIDEFRKSYRQFAVINEDIILTDYQEESYQFKLEDFFDVHHLNQAGADFLTIDLSEKINELK